MFGLLCGQVSIGHDESIKLLELGCSCSIKKGHATFNPYMIARGAAFEDVKYLWVQNSLIQQFYTLLMIYAATNWV